MAIPEGWYADPTQPGQERWWTGTEWSESSRLGGLTPPPPPFVPTQQAPSSGGGGKSGCFGVGMGVMFGILGATVLLVLAVVGIFVSAADDGVDTIEAVSSPTVEQQTTSTVELQTTSTAESEVGSTATAGQPVETGDKCVVVGVDTFGDIQVRLEVTSPFDTVSETLEITYSLIGADGIRFDTGNAYPEFVGPREFLVVDADSMVSADERPTTGMTCQILNIEQWDF